ncbi:MAG: cyclase family protein [Bacteroidales bacterium]|nr:cyclase family protein [Bacteroidales bacterium]
MKNILIFITLFTIAGCNLDFGSDMPWDKGTWVDLTWDFEESTTYWPTNITFSHDTVSYGINDKGYFYSSFFYAAEEHGGTHFDAPLHFAENGRSIEQILPEEFTGEGVCVDVSENAFINRDYLASVNDFKKWEKQYGRIPDRAIVLLRTGFGKFWGDPLKYTGTLKQGPQGVAELHFPGLDPEAAEWLVKERNIKAFGLDTPSIDRGQSTEFMTHRILFSHDVTAYENIAHLELVPPRDFYVVAAPMKIKGDSGAPLRLMVWIPKK